MGDHEPSSNSLPPTNQAHVEHTASQYLHDLNFDTFEFINQALELGLNYETTKAYEFDQSNDYRVLSEVKHHPDYAQVDYHQLFESKHGFIKNLSILDLIFMEGPP